IRPNPFLQPLPAVPTPFARSASELFRVLCFAFQPPCLQSRQHPASLPALLSFCRLPVFAWPLVTHRCPNQRAGVSRRHAAYRRFQQTLPRQIRSRTIAGNTRTRSTSAREFVAVRLRCVLCARKFPASEDSNQVKQELQRLI